MRPVLTLAAVLVSSQAISEAVPSTLTIKLGAVRKSDIGVNVNFSITNADSEPIGIVFATCTALDSDGQPKAKADDNVHNVRPGETAFGQAQFEEGEATVKDGFTCRIDQISR